MIRIALVEDEADVRAQLQGYVQRHTRQYGTEFAVTEFADGMELLDDYRPVYDILFLDVEMKHLDGMETARRVRELDKDVIIVFITNMAQYAIGGGGGGGRPACNTPRLSATASPRSESVTRLPMGKSLCRWSIPAITSSPASASQMQSVR